MKGISFVIPVYNSEKTIALVIKEIEETMLILGEEYEHEIILVNDFSKDNSMTVCKHLCANNPSIKLMSFSKNFGQHHALMAGLRKTTGEYVVFLDDDLQTPPKETTKLIDKLEEGYDVVFAQYSDKNHFLLRNLGTRLNSLMAKALIHKPKEVEMSSFVIFRRYIANEIIKYDNPFLYLPGLIFRATTNIGGVMVEHRERYVGKSNYNYRKLLSLWFNGFTNFSVKPLRVSSIIGFIFSITAFISMVVFTIKRLLYPDIQTGWTSIIVLIMFFGGIQLISLGLVGEYVGRIFLCINKAPQYVVKEYYYNHSNNDVKNNDVETEKL